MEVACYRNFSRRKIPHVIIICILEFVQNYAVAAKITCKIMKPKIAWDQGAEYFTNTWAVRVSGGINAAQRVARSLGYNLLREKVSGGLPDVYLLLNPKYPQKTKYAGELVTRRLEEHSKFVRKQIVRQRTICCLSEWFGSGHLISRAGSSVAENHLKVLAHPIDWAEQQAAESVEVRRQVRSELWWTDISDAYTCPKNENRTPVLNMNDEFWPKQHYIKDCRHGDEKTPDDLNIAPVWVKHRLFGRNIKVIIIDEGVETRHADLVDNYDPALGLDLQDGDNTPDPAHFAWIKQSHGTRCAGIVGMTANNTICGVGIAPLVTLGAVRLLGRKLETDYKIALALSFKHVEVHIMSNSWGPTDNGKIMPYAGPLTRMAIKTGIEKGRYGRGIIYLIAAGNGKKKGDNCACDRLISTPYSIAVASCSRKGMVTSFSERCASIMVTAYTSLVTTDVAGKCMTDFYGTSASTPLVAGAIALALEAHSTLSWRDIQHLLAWTSEVAPLQHNPPLTWVKNGAGFYVSHDFGFGLLNINALIEEAKGFQNVGPMNSCVASAKTSENGEIFRNSMEVEITTDSCRGTPSEVKYLEHVELTVSMGFPRRGDLKIILTSPSGTKAIILDWRPRDSYPYGIHYWAFDSVMTWGESPEGKWKVLFIGKKHVKEPSRFRNAVRKFRFISSKNKNEGSVCYPGRDESPDSALLSGELNYLTLTFHGTKQMPTHYKKGYRTYDKFTLAK